MVPSKTSLCSFVYLVRRGLLACFFAGMLEVPQAAILDRLDTYRGQDRNDPPQLDCNEAGVLLWLFLYHPPSHHANFPRPTLSQTFWT
jgi:hypothetical protein